MVHAREAVDQRKAPGTVPRAGADVSGGRPGGVVSGAVPRARLGGFDRPRGQCDRSLRRWAVRGADGASRHGNSGAVKRRNRGGCRRTLSRPRRMRQRRRPGRAARLRPCLEVGAAPARIRAEPAAGGQRGRGRRRQSARHALSVQAIGAGAAHRGVRGGRWRQHRSHHLPGIGQPALRGRVQRPGRP